MIRSTAIVTALGILLCAAAPAWAQQSFPTPEDALNALVVNLRSESEEGIIAIFGEDGREVILTGEPPRDRELWRHFLDMYDDTYALERSEDLVYVALGEDLWPFPIPLSQNDDGTWSFDVEEGEDEILARRIGQNELETVELLTAYGEVQRDYRTVDHDGDGVMEFAMTIISGEGTRDGLFWPGGDSPIGDLIARATAEGYAFDGEEREPDPYNGYYFKMLDRQGARAPGGAFEYVVNGNKVAGHALLAFPASYGDTGVWSFMVAENGVILEADLGEDTLEAAASIDTYNPGAGWAPVELEE